jgi:hypothetical protein
MNNLDKEKQEISSIKEKNNTPFAFFLTCPHCQKNLTPQDFDNNHFTIAHLQTYFQSKETEYKQQLLSQMEKEIEDFPLFQQIKSENEKLKLIVEGYKLGSTKNSKTKGEELEKYILEQLQASYNGNDEINKITHLGEKADIIHTIHKEEQQIAKIIYEIKNVDK